MDFVVVGFGLGALGVLLGVVMLGWLAPRSQRAAARVSSPDAAARCRAVAAEHRGTGQAFVYAGGAMLLATVAGLVGSLDDRTGAFLVTTTATVSAVGILLGGHLQRIRHPTPPRRRIHLAPAASASREEAISVEEMTPLPSAVSGAFGTGATDPAPLEDSPVAAESTDLESWQPADRATGNGSDDADLAEREDHQAVGQVAPSTHSTEATPSRPDDEDPPSGHS